MHVWRVWCVNRERVAPPPLSLTTTNPLRNTANTRMTSQKNTMEHEGGIDTAREWAYKVRPWGFLSFLSTDYSNSTMSHASVIPHIIGPRPWTFPHRPTLPWHGQWSSHTRLLTTTMPLKHWGACSAPRLPFPWLSDPHKVARQCRLTLALPLRGLLVISGGIPLRGLGYPWVFVNLLPVPTKTHAHGRGYGFWQIRAWVTLENPRAAHDIPYSQTTP